MFKMHSKSGRTYIKDLSTNRVVSFDKLGDALLFMDMMKDIYYRHGKRCASEPYPVRTLCPGEIPVRLN